LSETTQPEVLVEAALEQLLSWPGLARSPQLAKFLNYIVKAKLSGDEASIKAYAIAVDVFGRPQSFDPQSDPIVRVQARRLRAALEEYYRGEGLDSPVRIFLPVGRYVPEFRYRDESGAPEGGSQSTSAIPPPQITRDRRSRTGLKDWMLYALVVIVGVGILVAMAQVLTPRPSRMTVPQPPSIGVAEFTAIASGDGPAVGSIAGLAIELVTDLQLFDDITPTYVQSGSLDDASGPKYLLTGIARQEAGMVQVTASLRANGSDIALWSFTQSIRADQVETSIDDLSQVFAEQLGSHRGPLFVEANRWLDETPNIDGNETDFLCGLLFTRSRDSARIADAARARDCLTSVLKRGDSALALALRGSMLLDDAAATQPLGLDPEPVAEAGRLLAQALKLDSTSSVIWRENARYLLRTRRFSEAEAAYTSALQLNPANLDARAGYGRMLSFAGASAQGLAMAEEALRRAIAPPHWYYGAPAVNALRAGNDKSVIAYCDRLASGDTELASVLGTVAAYRSRDEGTLNRYFAQLLDVTRFRRFGILPVLRQRILDTALVEEIATQLKSAGVAAEALNGSF
jgi:tetratricopeptide (TPR) repeat protein